MTIQQSDLEDLKEKLRYMVLGIISIQDSLENDRLSLRDFIDLRSDLKKVNQKVKKLLDEVKEIDNAL